MTDDALLLLEDQVDIHDALQQLGLRKLPRRGEYVQWTQSVPSGVEDRPTLATAIFACDQNGYSFNIKGSEIEGRCVLDEDQLAFTSEDNEFFWGFVEEIRQMELCHPIYRES